MQVRLPGGIRLVAEMWGGGVVMARILYETGRRRSKTPPDITAPSRAATTGKPERAVNLTSRSLS